MSKAFKILFGEWRVTQEENRDTGTLREIIRWVPRKDAGLPDEIHTLENKDKKEVFPSKLSFPPIKKLCCYLSRLALQASSLIRLVE